MELSNQHKTLVALAFRTGDQRTIDVAKMAQALGISAAEGQRMATELANAGMLEGWAYQSSTALFSSRGRLLAHELVELGYADNYKGER